MPIKNSPLRAFYAMLPWTMGAWSSFSCISPDRGEHTSVHAGACPLQCCNAPMRRQLGLLRRPLAIAFRDSRRGRGMLAAELA